MAKHTKLVAVEDAVSISWERADGLAELCRGMLDSDSDEANSWGIIRDALYMIKDELVRANEILGELHDISWEHADKSHETYCKSMRWLNSNDEDGDAE